MKSPTGRLYCDFCGKSEKECDHTTFADNDRWNVAICLDCVLTCVRTLLSRDENEGEKAPPFAACGKKSKQPHHTLNTAGQQGVHGGFDGLSACNIQGSAQDAAPLFGDIPGPEQCLDEIKKLFAAQGDQRAGVDGKAAVGTEDVDPLGGYARIGNGPSPWSPAYSRFNKAMLKKIPVVDKELFIIITCLQQAREGLWSTYLQFAEDVEREGKIND